MSQKAVKIRTSEMQTILLPVKPEFCRKILSGKKRYEFRKTKPQRSAERIVLYATAPVKMVVGEVTVESVLVGAPENIWRLCQWEGGIDERRYRSYYKNSAKAVAFKLKDPIKYEPPVSLADIGVNSVPQSFIYLQSN